MKNVGRIPSENNTVHLPENYSLTMAADVQFFSVKFVDAERSSTKHILLNINRQTGVQKWHEYTLKNI